MLNRMRNCQKSQELLLTLRRPTRQLDDAELDSGDDEGRNDRAASEPVVETETQEALTEYPDFGRQPLPEPSDGEVVYLRCTVDDPC